jgi:hypothetical protein
MCTEAEGLVQQRFFINAMATVHVLPVQEVLATRVVTGAKLKRHEQEDDCTEFNVLRESRNCSIA